MSHLLNWKYKKVSIRHSSQFFSLFFFKIMTFQKSEAQIDVFVFLKKIHITHGVLYCA